MKIELTKEECVYVLKALSTYRKTLTQIHHPISIEITERLLSKFWALSDYGYEGGGDA